MNRPGLNDHGRCYCEDKVADNTCQIGTSDWNRFNWLPNGCVTTATDTYFTENSATTTLLSGYFTVTADTNVPHNPGTTYEEKVAACASACKAWTVSEGFIVHKTGAHEGRCLCKEMNSGDCIEHNSDIIHVGSGYCNDMVWEAMPDYGFYRINKVFTWAETRKKWF